MHVGLQQLLNPEPDVDAYEPSGYINVASDRYPLPRTRTRD